MTLYRISMSAVSPLQHRCTELVRVVTVLSCLLFAASASGGPEEDTTAHHPFGLHAVRDDFRGVADLHANCIRKIILWQDGEPRPGEYRTLDSMVRSTQQLGLSLVITLRPVSQWGGGNVRSRGELPLHRFSATPRDMPAWKEFVRKFVERYDGDGFDDMPGLTIPIRFWQVENEVLWQWQESMEQYLQFLAETSASIRSADPQSQVILGGLTQCVALAVGAGIGDKEYVTYGQVNPQQYPRDEVLQSSRYRNYKKKVDVLLAGASEHCDIVDFHDYGDDAADLTLIMKWLTAEMRRYGYSKPVWSLENAGPFFDFSDEKFAQDVVKRHVVSVDAGVQRMFWSSLTPALGWSENFQRLALKNHSGGKAPAYFAYQQMAQTLDGFVAVERQPEQPQARHFRFSFADGRWVDVAWSDGPVGAVTLAIPAATRSVELVPLATSSRAAEPTRRLKVDGGRLEIELGSPIFITPLPP